MEKRNKPSVMILSAAAATGHLGSGSHVSIIPPCLPAPVPTEGGAGPEPSMVQGRQALEKSVRLETERE
jgi:hypothetical protein